MPEMTIHQALHLAIQHHQAGRLQNAESIYRQILAVEPRHADALNLLGVIAAQMGRHDTAIELIRQAIGFSPQIPLFHANLGEACRVTGQIDESIAACRRAIDLKSDYPEAHCNLGCALYDKGLWDEAINAYHQAIALKPDYPMAYSNLGNALRKKGQLEEAIAAYRQAIALKPDYPEAHSNLGTVLRERGQLEESIAACRQAIALKPDFAEAFHNLGISLMNKGCLDEAIVASREAILRKPDLWDAHTNLGITLNAKGMLAEAIAAFRDAIALKPDHPASHTNLGNALKDVGRFDEAVTAHRQAIALQSNRAEAHDNLGPTQNMEDLDKAVADDRQATVSEHDFARCGSNLLLTLHYHPGWDAEVIADEHRRWESAHAEPLRQLVRPAAHDRDPNRRLRIGYVSPDFRNHSVAFFLEGLLAQHDRSKVEVFCYSDVIKADAVTARMEREALSWRRITGLGDAQVADLIREDRIDILVDLAGHTANSRLLVFARKPAPLQVTWLGYPNTTGMNTIDYRITDALADPPGTTEHLHSEQLERLPRSAWCYRPPEESPLVKATPAQERGHITFGCFNAMPKVNDPLLEIWSNLLQASPNSRLMLKNKALGESSVREHLKGVFERAGIAPERLELIGYATDLASHLAAYERVDIALDTFPYHGTTTTCEALWMGVPVVTLAGKTHVSRVGVSLLSNLGHPEWIANSSEEYVKIAVELANDLSRLMELRATLRETMQASPLMDATGFARDMETAYRQMWRKWCTQAEFPQCPK